MDSSEFIERNLVLLIGINKRAIPSMLHLQKEMFLLSNFKQELKDELNFEKHYFGPYSQVLNEAIKNPSYMSNVFDFEDNKIFLSNKGKKEFDKMVNLNSSEIKFIDLLSALKLLRDIYDKLSKNELMFLIYETYPEYVELSKISERLLKNKYMRNRIIEGLFSKGVITEKRYVELKDE